MNVFIGYESAVEYWRSVSLAHPGAYERSYQLPMSSPYLKKVVVGNRLLRLEDRKDFLPKALAKTPSFADCKPSQDALREVELCGAGCFNVPIEFVVSAPLQRWRSERAVCHVCADAFPRGSFVRLSGGVLVSSPELCFVQMASRLSMPQLLMLGYELCGTYSTQGGEYNPRPPLSNIERMKAFLDRAGSMRGVPRARQALRFLSEGSASPMESMLALLLCLPCRMGGYAFPVPLMNQPVALKRFAKKSADHPVRYVDLFWPSANLGIEYDSDQVHTGSEKIAKDAARKNALFAAGANILTVTRKQLMSGYEMDKVASVASRHLGVRIRAKGYDLSVQREKLRWELLRGSGGGSSRDS